MLYVIYGDILIANAKLYVVTAGAVNPFPIVFSYINVCIMNTVWNNCFVHCIFLCALCILLVSQCNVAYHNIAVLEFYDARPLTAEAGSETIKAVYIASISVPDILWHILRELKFHTKCGYSFIYLITSSVIFANTFTRFFSQLFFHTQLYLLALAV